MENRAEHVGVGQCPSSPEAPQASPKALAVHPSYPLDSGASELPLIQLPYAASE